MSWRLPEHPHRTYPRNALVAVIVALRFDPVLKVAERVPDFQERVRGRFPLYEEREHQTFEFTPEGVRTRQGKEFRFSAKQDPVTLILIDQQIGLEYRAYQERTVLLEDFALASGALRALGEVQANRFGVRYVNQLDRAAISKDLGREVSWTELVKPAFLSTPGDLADLEGSRLASEFTSPMSLGQMTLRTALLPQVAGNVTFRLDIDRYRDDTPDLNLLPETLVSFADDIYRTFMAATGPALAEWMEK